MYKWFVHLIIGVLAMLLIVGCGGGGLSSRQPIAEFRSVPIPVREHGYQHFESLVINSQSELNRFLSKIAAENTWNEKDQFVRAIQNADLDFNQESLVLIRDTEGSGSIQVSLDTPFLESETLTSTLRRTVPDFLSADLADYAFAFAVSKAKVKAVKVQVENKEDIYLTPSD